MAMQTKEMIGDEKFLISELGLRIAKARSEQGYTRIELAKLSDLNTQYLYDVETGKRNITIFVLAKLAKSLNTSLSSLLKGLDL